MKGGSKRARSGGYTIVEVMMVLAVTGLMFVTAAVLISGRQRQTEFSQATRALQTQLQQVINEVAAGYYPNQGNFNCTAGAGGPQLASSAAGQGTNAGCIFLGKVVQFKLAGSSPENFVTYPIAGLQQVTGTSNEVTTLAEAKPVVIAPSSVSGGSFPNASVATPYQYGLTTYSLTYNGGSIGAVAFTNSLAAYNSGNIISGSQQVNMVPVTGTSLGATSKATVDAINANLATSPLNPNSGVQLCVVSGGTNQSGLLTIGSNGRQLTVTLALKENKTCV